MVEPEAAVDDSVEREELSWGPWFPVLAQLPVEGAAVCWTVDKLEMDLGVVGLDSGPWPVLLLSPVELGQLPVEEDRPLVDPAASVLGVNSSPPPMLPLSPVVVLDPVVAVDLSRITLSPVVVL